MSLANEGDRHAGMALSAGGWVAMDPCDAIGHEWADAGGGLLICMVCEAERWADEETHDG